MLGSGSGRQLHAQPAVRSCNAAIFRAGQARQQRPHPFHLPENTPHVPVITAVTRKVSQTHPSQPSDHPRMLFGSVYKSAPAGTRQS